jgi:hypothetical protein
MSRFQLGEWGLSGLSDTADLIVSELVTNAVRACQDCHLPAQVTLKLSMEGRLPLEGADRLVRIEVWDPDPSLPGPAGDVGPLDESGRGLHLVDAMSGGRWGARRCPEGGKVVWAELAPPLPCQRKRNLAPPSPRRRR